MNTLPITTLYGAVFALLLIPITIRVGLHRDHIRVFFLHGDDEALLRLIRSHANFLEYVPFGLILIALVEINGASVAFLHGLAGTLLVSRIMHYVTLNTNPIAVTRQISMFGTIMVFLVSSGWLLLTRF